MSRHWNPRSDVARVREARVKHDWPAGATVGVVALAAACLALGVIVYQVAGPRDSFADTAD
jgi:formate hydrogenlyase subunit 3/multisubunit Na+/H+ antiporter MnhD subunit